MSSLHAAKLGKVEGGMMGHGQKNANRGEAINRNAARISKCAEKLKELGHIVKDVRLELGDEISVSHRHKNLVLRKRHNNVRKIGDLGSVSENA